MAGARRRKGIIEIDLDRSALADVQRRLKEVGERFALVGHAIQGVERFYGSLARAGAAAMRVLQEAAKNEAIEAGLAAQVGGLQQAEEWTRRLATATGRMVGDTSLQSSAAKLLQGGLQLTAEQMGGLLAATVKLGFVQGKQAPEAIAAMTEGLLKHSDEQLRALGLSTQVQAAIAAEAKRRGVSAEALDVETKRALALQEAQRALGEQGTKLAGADTHRADAVARISTAFDNMWKKINDRLTDSPKAIATLEKFAATLASFGEAAVAALEDMRPFVDFLAANPVLLGVLGGGAAGAAAGLPFGPYGALIGGALGAIGGGYVGSHVDTSALQRPANTSGLADGLAQLATAGSARSQADIDRLSRELAQRTFEMQRREGR